MNRDSPAPLAPPEPSVRTSRRQYSLRAFVTIALSGMVLLTAGIITWISWANARHNASTTIALVTEQALTQTQMRVRSFLKPAIDAVELSTIHAAAGILDLEDNAAIERYFFHSLQSQPELETLCWADTQGRFVMVQRDDDGSLDTKIIIQDSTQNTRRTLLTNRTPQQRTLEKSPPRTAPTKPDTYEPRRRPWYLLAIAADHVVWTDAYIFHTKHIPGLTAARRVERNGELYGVLCADLTLRDVSDFLSRLRVGKTGKVVLVDAKSRLLAAPDHRDLIESSTTGELRLKAAIDSAVPEIAAFANTPEWQAALKHADADITDQIRFNYEGTPHIGSLKRLDLNDRVAWLVGAVVPEEDFLGPINDANATNGLISLALLLVAFITSLFIARRVARSLSTLVNEAHEISRLSFGDHPEVTSSFREVNDVLDAFENMKIGLRAFQKYLPLKLVRRLLANQEEPELGSEFMELTIFFSDIIGFTPINENMHPMDMAQRLGEYLAALTEEIETRQGTVVQYVGDEIMALWGAPQSVSEHAELACRAALACQARVPGLWDEQADIPEFRTRFGIHTAEVAVGHFGSAERLYYGAIGDGINATSRLEGLNKYYGTNILVSDSTARLVSRHFRLRRIDRVAVKGKTEAIIVYELLGEKDDQTINIRWYDRWEDAFNQYLQREFSAAAVLFSRLLEERPKDTPARMMMIRCRQFHENPPPKSWDGVHRMQNK